MPSVTAVEAKGDKAAMLVMDDGSRVWTPEKARADELVGKPIPGDWTQKQGDYGPQAFPPRERKGGGFGGGAAAFRNTERGQAIEQRAMNARTALMQAEGEDSLAILATAEAYFDWLESKASGGASMPVVASPRMISAPDEGREKTAGRKVSKGPVQTEQASLDGEAGGACSHTDTSPLRPDGGALPKGFVRCLSCGTVKKQ